MGAQLILASASPRRKELLEQLKLKIIIQPVDLDETPKPGEKPLAYVERVAAEKSQLCAAVSTTILPILAADTAVILDETILGKPKNKDDAMAMLSRLSGRTHQVFSAVSLRGKAHWNTVSITEVTFRKIKEIEMQAYWESGEPVDKAGSYAIQGLGGLFVESIKGSYSGVVGLPLFETAQLLSKQGIDLLV
ncbi:MAG: septum formation inhibitor Maf [Methylococcaceae bacterium]|nr:septum formation inhibitor Maf [Methylococcaceae bacterium]